jgi:peptidoglycan hydrolase-like protein with peptidoglycan-binding domain
VSVVGKIAASFSSTAGGFFLLSVTVALGLVLYVVTTPDSASAPAHINAISVPPLVRAVPVSSPSPSANVVAIASTALTKPVAAPVLPSDRGVRVRQLQKALARAQCYNGPISGIWSDASKDAMRGFAETVNALLPVDSPDDTLVALVESNDTATCARGRAISTGTLTSELHSASLQQARKETSSPAAPLPAAVAERSPADERTMLDHPWAPAEMLTPPKETIAAIPAQDEPHAPAVAVTPNHVASIDSAAAPASSAIHFEDDKALPPPQSAAPSSITLAPDTATPVVQPPKPKKTKTAKRKPSQYDDVQTSISKGFDTLQRSLSSMF